MHLRGPPVRNQLRAFAGHLLPLQILSTRNAQLDQPTWLNPSSTEDALRSFRQTYDFHSCLGRSGKRVTVNFCSTCGTKLFLDLERFPEILASTVEHSTTRTGSPACPRRLDTSSRTQLKEARSFLPVSVRFASMPCSMTERRSGP